MGGTYQKVTACCEVFPEAMGGPGQYWYRCPKCAQGSYFHDVPMKSKYWPTDYEKSLEARIVELERRIDELAQRECPTCRPRVGK